MPTHVMLNRGDAPIWPDEDGILWELVVATDGSLSTVRAPMPAGPPTDLEVDRPSSGTVTLSWTAPTDTGYPTGETLHYRVRLRSPAGHEVFGDDVTSTTVDATGLTNGVHYLVEIVT